MKKKVFCVLFALVLVLSFSLVTAVPVGAVTPPLDRVTAILAAADNLVLKQSDDGGFDWIWDDDLTDPSATNCLGITAMGILKGYELDDKASYETALAKAYKYVVDNPPDWEVDPLNANKWKETTPGVDSFPDVTFLVWLAEAAEAEADASLLAAINVIQEPDITAFDIAALAKERWDGRVSHLGSLYPSETGTATTMAEYIRDLRHGQNLDALIPWDLEAAVKAALALNARYPGEGYDTQAISIAGVIFASVDDGTHFNSGDTTQEDYVLGLTGAIEAFEEVGLYSVKESGLKDILLGIQQADGSWKYYGASPATMSVQSTAYAVMALLRQGDDDAVIAARKGADWLVKNQLGEGGWYAEGGTGSEFLEMDSEAAWALATAEAPVTIGTDGYYSIQSAIDAVAPGGTIDVAAGTYTESVVIAKPLTLQGPNVGISPNTGLRVAEAVITGESPLIRLPTDADVNPLTIEGFTFRDADSRGVSGSVILAHGGSAGWGNVTIRSNRFIDNYGPAVGVWATSGLANWIITDNLIDGVTGPSKSGIYLDLDYLDLGAGSSFTGWQVSNNTIKNTEYGGIMVHHGVDIVISGNTIEDVQKTGIQSSGIQGNVIITDNVITSAMLDQTEPFRAGIRLYGTDLADEYGESELIGPVWVTNNIVTDSYIGFAIKDGHDITGKVVHVNYNSFTRNSEAGLRHGGTGTLDAKYNWWGAIGGPGGEGSGKGDNVTTNVDYDPWLTENQADTIREGIAYFGSTIPLEPGWNTLSVPLKLKDSADTMSEIVALGDFLISNGPAKNWEIVYQYNSGSSDWGNIGTSDAVLVPLRGYYIKILGTDTVDFPVLYSGQLGLPTLKLSNGWNLIGSGFGIDKTDYGIAATDDEDRQKDVATALYSIKDKCSVVVSPSTQGQEAAWGTTVIDSGKDMIVGEAYWVFMTNPVPTLAGFEVTPIYDLP